VLSSDRLLDALAEDDSGTGALGTVQTYLSQLRKLAPDIGGALVTRPAGYVFELSDEALDAARFEAMLRAAAAEPDSGNRLRLLDGALGLWRGGALEEFAWTWAATERARLERRRVDALTLRAQTRLERGEHLEALSELDALVDEYPLDERLCGLRMVAAYRAGRQAEALRAYQELRRNLAQELGVDAGPALVELERQILEHDPALRANGGGRAATSLEHHDEAETRSGAAGDVDALRDVRAVSRIELGLATVAVLISDLVGSAAMRTAVGDHRADEVERWHERIIHKAVADYQGTIIKRLGDGAMAVFTTATDAVAAAAAIQTRITRESATEPVPLQVRIGVSAGEVVVEQDDVRGLPPTEAARLCARAEAGQILTTALVQNLAAARSAATFRPFGAFELKGLPGPVPLFEVPWPIGRSREMPLPQALDAIPREFSFVGRDRELASLRSLWDESGNTSVLHTALVTGEAGAGKSRLVSEFVRAVASEDQVVLYGRCDEDAGYPFQPVAEWLRHYLAHASPADVGMVRARHGAELSRLVPELLSAHFASEQPSAVTDVGDPYPLYEAVSGWLTLVADTAPLLLVLDDLQWASRPTLAVLQHLLATAPRFPGMLLATCRDDDTSEHEAMSLLGLEKPRRAVRRVPVGGLAPADVRAMVAESRGATSTGPLAGVADVADEIYAESSGNPLFVTSLAQQLESDELERTPTSRRPVRPPERVMSLVANRLARLQPATVTMLQTAAVIGTEFEFSLLRVVTGDESDLLLDRLAQSVEARYLVELPGAPLRYRFPHGVVRSALLETVPVSQRLRLHRLAGRGLEQLGRAGDDRAIATLAHHYCEAAPLGEADRAVEYCRLAADVATEQLAHHDAVAWYERALDVAGAEGIADRDRYELLLALGRAQVCAGIRESRTSLFRAYGLAIAEQDATRAAEAVLSLNRGFFSRTGETDGEAVAALEATLAMIGDTNDSGSKASLLAALASELVWSDDGDRRFSLSDHAVAMARRANDPHALARVLGLRIMTILAADTLRERTANCYELLGLAEELQDDLLRFDAAFQRGGTALEAGDAEAAHDMVEVAVRIAGRLQQPRLLWRARLMQTAQAVFRGDLDDAEFYGGEALQLGRRAGQGNDAFLFHTEQQLEIRRWRGRLDEHLGQLRPFAGQPGLDFGAAITRYLFEAGDVEAAGRVYRDLVTGSFLPLRRDMLQTSTLCNLSFLAARHGDVATAEALYDELSPFADAFANTTIAKPVGWHSLGLLAATMGKLDAAESFLRKAIGVHEMVGAPLFRAESEIELARLLRDAGRTSEVESLVRSARAVADARGAGLITRECDAVDR
jgi:class 3 adenylate cyclase